jgi:pyruvate dehydrogenase phosphatase
MIFWHGLSGLENAKSHAEVQTRLTPCYAGSCALLALYDPVQSQVYVASTGDSRAVLGSRTSTSGEFDCVAMSTDQNASNASEIERVKALHPNEENLITKRDGDCPRYVGIAVTRTFSDARWKWSKEALTKCEEEFPCKPPLGITI